MPDWLTAFKEQVEAGQAASQGVPPIAADGAASALSVGASGKPPASQPADDSHQYLCTLLETAGLFPNQATALADYILTLTPEKVELARGGLENLDTAPAYLEKLTTAYTRDKGEPLPQSENPDDDIPF